MNSTFSTNGLALAGMVAALAALLSSCPAGGKAQEAHAPAPLEGVETLSVSGSESTSYVELTGSVAGRNSVALTTKLMSSITYLVAEEGQSVSAGEVLVRIDDSDIMAMRSEAAAYRAEAEAALGEVDAVRQQAEAGVGQANAAVEQARAALADAERDHGRMSELFATQVISRSEMDKFDLALKIARENLLQAEAAVRQASAAVSQADSQTPQVEAKRSQADAKDRQAAALQDYSVLRAPFDGIVTARYFDAGQLAIPGQPILVIEQNGELRVKLAVPDRVAADLQLGDELELHMDNDPDRHGLVARVVVLGSSADPASRTVPAELELPQDSGLHSGQFVRVRIPLRSEGSIIIPLSAVATDGERRFVWRVSSGGMLTTAPVDLGDSLGESVLVLRGLSDGDVIVSHPHSGLYAGARIAGHATAGEH